MLLLKQTYAKFAWIWNIASSVAYISWQQQLSKIFENRRFFPNSCKVGSLVVDAWLVGLHWLLYFSQNEKKQHQLSSCVIQVLNLGWNHFMLGENINAKKKKNVGGCKWVEHSNGYFLNRRWPINCHSSVNRKAKSSEGQILKLGEQSLRVKVATLAVQSRGPLIEQVQEMLKSLQPWLRSKAWALPAKGTHILPWHYSVQD